MRLIRLDDDGQFLKLRVEGHLVPGGLVTDDDPLENEFGSQVFERTVFLNMDSVEGINSAGVSWLLNINRRFQRGGGRLLIHSPPGMVMQALRLLRVDRVLELVENEAEAERRATAGRTP